MLLGPILPSFEVSATSCANLAPICNPVFTEKSKILKEDGYMEKSHTMIWVFVLVVIAVAVLWFFFMR